MEDELVGGADGQVRFAQHLLRDVYPEDVLQDATFMAGMRSKVEEWQGLLERYKPSALSGTKQALEQNARVSEAQSMGINPAPWVLMFDEFLTEDE